jgi:hypothetical protein
MTVVRDDTHLGENARMRGHFVDRPASDVYST